VTGANDAAATTTKAALLRIDPPVRGAVCVLTLTSVAALVTEKAALTARKDLSCVVTLID
jgi:hypothetical protein